jgi:hypothetical protein
MSDDMLRGPPPQLQVQDIVMESYRYCWDNRSALILPIVVLMLLEFACAWVTPTVDSSGSLPGVRTFLTGFLSIWLFLIGTMALAVGIHRRILLDEARDDLALFRINRALLSYIGTTFKLSFAAGLLCFALFLPIAITQGLMTEIAQQPPSLDRLVPAALAVLCIDLLFTARFMLALPGAAVGGQRSIRQSWHLTRGNWGRIVIILLAVTLPFQLFSLAIGEIGIGQSRWAVEIVYAVISTMSVPVLAVALSLSYGTLTARPTARAVAL